MAGQSSTSTTQIDLLRMLLDEAAEPKALPLPLLTEITNGFSDEMEIGRGGFAVVYKGVLKDRAVALKRLLKTYMHQEEFLREVECLVKVRHKNIVRFLGYCVESQGNVQSYNGNIVIAKDLQKILCFEYLPKGTLYDYITDASGGLDWRTRYQIIKGVCEGMQYLHETNIVHLDLKPANVLLDETLIPKITDFGLSRCFKDDQTRWENTKVGGTFGYLAPEFNDGTITYKFDLYSLGVIITEIITGKRGYQDVDDVVASWSNRCDRLEWNQIRVCTEIGLECSDFSPGKRPKSVKHIVDRLAKTESSSQVVAAEGVASNDLLSVRPSVLRFPFKNWGHIRCPLHLTNTTDEHVAFKLKKRGKSKGLVHGTVYGVVPPRSTCTLVVETRFIRDERLEETEIDDLILRSTTFRREPNKVDKYGWPASISSPYHDSKSVKHEMAVKAFCTQPREMVMSLSKQILPEIQVLSEYKYDVGFKISSLGIDQAKQWIIIGQNRGEVTIWDNWAQKQVHEMKVSREEVTCVKLIARKQWLVIGTLNGYIHVYNCEAKMRKIAIFRASGTYMYLNSLAFHPTRPYLLSSDHCGMKLWDWDKSFECIHNFEKEHSEEICQVAFNLNDTIASASEDHLVKVWSIGSPKSNYTLSGHADIVVCLDFFTCDDQEYLITGSNDKTAKIWDMRTKICIHTLEAFVSPVTCVVYEPNLQILITGSEDGNIYYWNTLNSYRLERIINTGDFGPVVDLACLMGRVVIGRKESVVIMGIDNVNNYQEEYAGDYNEPQLTGETTCKVTPAVSSSQHPLEICFLCEEDPCSLQLTNKIDEHVAFCLAVKSGKCGLPSECPNWEDKSNWMSYGIVPPRSTYILFSRMEEYPERLEYIRDFGLTLHSSISGDRYTFLFSNEDECHDFFTQTKGMGNTVHEGSVKEGNTTSAQFSRMVHKRKIITFNDIHTEYLFSMDAHPTEPWIITGHAGGILYRWNYYSLSIETDRPSKRPEGFHCIGNSTCIYQESADRFLRRPRRAVSAVKFMARKQWILAGSDDGVIHVYKCAFGQDEMEKITTFRAPDGYIVTSLAVHSTQVYVVLSNWAHNHEIMEVWGWDKGWECTQTYGDMLSRNDILVRSPDSPKSDHTLPGHSEKINCLHYFTCDDRQYLITGSDDCTAKIWDLKKKACIHTMAQEAIMSPVTSALSLLPHRPYLLTGTEQGTVQVWSSNDFRLERTVDLGSGARIPDLACFMGLQRVVVADEMSLSIMELIDQEVEAVASVVNNEKYVSPSD